MGQKKNETNNYGLKNKTLFTVLTFEYRQRDTSSSLSKSELSITWFWTYYHLIGFSLSFSFNIFYFCMMLYKKKSEKYSILGSTKEKTKI